ncbi:efflux RND transporter periplasmic adaptor subunit [Variovorax sp. Sphag1AA]|uniref:efflux RND transporter periplasmic adaptor subunit n=1 Tax=Variovorax sp. Sphag1AA TaxID=2587027 RepID=UPI00160DBA95|nr:efflux RND transporter periplasmic adaptor subunit [Variovorax sp. Sphag1AA]MBB3176506.1 membrane fusion protein (multidrug efflux system) [Variovorax sp. Sphag1AA]
MLPLLCAAVLLSACSKSEPEKAAPPPTEVSALTVKAQTVPVTYEFVGQTESSQQVEIRARVNGFLEKRVYTEGTFVEPGQVLFRMDVKPFEASLKAAKAELAQQQARLATARANLARVKPLVADNALAVKDLDDATGSDQAAAAAVEAAAAKVTDAQLNLGYTTITSPVAGQSSFAKVQDGAYVNAENSLLTYVAKLDPMRVNFSLSENESLRLQDEIAKGKLIKAPRDDYAVELVLADGSSFPAQGRITFADASFSQETGTFLLRAELPNPKGELRPGQFVRVKVHGFQRPNSIIVPQRAVQEGPRGEFVWVVDGEGKASQRPVSVGDWMGDQWLVTAGLKDGERVVVDGFMRLAPGAPVKVNEVQPEPLPEGKAVGRQAGPTPAGAAAAAASVMPNAAPGAAGAAGAAGSAAGKAPAASSASSATGATGAPVANGDAVYFDRGRTALDATGQVRLVAIIAALKAKPDLRVVLNGYVDSSGDPKINAALAKRRAESVRDALLAADVPANQIEMKAPANIVGGDSPAMARRVDVILAGAR